MTLITTEDATTVRVDHETASYGIFCFNKSGDLFLNSDWGFYGYAWRSFNGTFKEFLAQCNSDYIIQKFETNYIEVTGKRMPPVRRKNVQVLINEFIISLK